MQALDHGVGALHELGHLRLSGPALVELPLQQAEPDAQRKQGLPRLVVELPGDDASLALLHLDEAA